MFSYLRQTEKNMEKGTKELIKYLKFEKPKRANYVNEQLNQQEFQILKSRKYIKMYFEARRGG